jgi:hypothetical protein
VLAPGKGFAFVDVFGEERSGTDVEGVFVFIEKTDFEASTRDEDVRGVLEEVTEGFVVDEADVYLSLDFCSSSVYSCRCDPIRLDVLIP